MGQCGPIPLVLSVTASLLGMALPDGRDVTVHTRYGRIRGTRIVDNSPVGGQTNMIETFLGVPYAAPPVGPMRFKASKPPDPWQGTWMATRFGPVCPQIPYYSYTQEYDQSENCLYLNIYVPYEPLKPEAVYAVMVFIHGGSYLLGGSSIYRGHLLARQGVIVITINYRLGLLGFLSANDPALPGNFGLLDQIQALKWTKENIASFRGDPERITVFGNSAGGASVGLLVLSPLAQGLFKQAVAQSGSPVAFWAAHNETVDLRSYAEAVIKVFGCNRGDMTQSVECLRSVHWKDFIKIHSQDHDVPKISPSGTDYKPCVDGHVIPSSPVMLLRTANLNCEIFVTGTVKDEWTRNLGWFLQDLFSNTEGLDNNFDDGLGRFTFESAITHVVTERFGWDETLSEIIKNEYTDWRMSSDPIENRNQYIHFFTDMSMVAPSVQTATLLHNRSVPVYLYSFSHHTQYTQPQWWRSYHAIELNFIFGSPFTGENVDEGGFQNYTDHDREISRRIMRIWSDFGKFRNPSLQGEKYKDSHVTWRPFSPDTMDYLHISSNGSFMESHLRADKMAFWNKLVPKIKAHTLKRTVTYTYRTEMWVFCSLTIALSIVTIWLLVYIAYTKKQIIDIKKRYKDIKPTTV